MRKSYIFLLLIFFACQKRQVEKLVIKGSDTEVNLVMEEAESYMQQDSAVSITITGGGSGVGITSLFNGRCDIALSSRPLNPYEEALAMRRGVEIVPTIFAKDAIAIIIHPSIKVDQLNMDQLGKIFAGKITDWSEVGGSPGKISLYGRQPNSGTYNFLKENVVLGDFASNIKQLTGTGQIVEAVKQDVNGIGYVGIGYVVDDQGKLNPGIKTIALQVSDTTLAVSPMNKSEIYSGNYPLTRPLYQFTIGKPTGKVKAFLDFQLSPAGQRIIEENGFFSFRSPLQAELR